MDATIYLTKSKLLPGFRCIEKLNNEERGKSFLPSSSRRITKRRCECLVSRQECTPCKGTETRQFIIISLFPVFTAELLFVSRSASDKKEVIKMENNFSSPLLAEKIRLDFCHHTLPRTPAGPGCRSAESPLRRCDSSNSSNGYRRRPRLGN